MHERKLSTSCFECGELLIDREPIEGQLVEVAYKGQGIELAIHSWHILAREMRSLADLACTCHFRSWPTRRERRVPRIVDGE